MQSGTGDIVKYGLIAAAAYFLWNKFGAQLMNAAPLQITSGAPASPGMLMVNPFPVGPVGSLVTTSGGQSSGSSSGSSGGVTGPNVYGGTTQSAGFPISNGAGFPDQNLTVYIEQPAGGFYMCGGDGYCRLGGPRHRIAIGPNGPITLTNPQGASPIDGNPGGAFGPGGNPEAVGINWALTTYVWSPSAPRGLSGPRVIQIPQMVMRGRGF